MRRAGLAVAVLSLGIGPWLAIPSASIGAHSLFASSRSGFALPGVYASDLLSAPSIGRATGCSCREIVVNASNVVRDADVRTGDAKTVNRSITYIAPTFDGNDEIEVEQEAEAHSGDAVIGQILGVDAGEGCARVHINATNLVEHSDVRTGDAIAKNQSVILLDPRIGIKEGDLEIEVDQEAEATSGHAIAGQIIGVRGGGGPCGGVIIDALNRLTDVEVRTGEATFSNSSRILYCIDVGCLDDVAQLLGAVDEVQVCADDGCTSVPVDDFVEMLENPPPPEPADEEDDHDDDAANAKKDAKRRELAARKADAWERLEMHRPEPATATAVQASPSPGPEEDD